MRRVTEAALFGGLAVALHVAALSALPNTNGGAAAVEGGPIEVSAPDAALRALVRTWDAPPPAAVAAEAPPTPDVPDTAADPVPEQLAAPSRPEATHVATLAGKSRMGRETAARPEAARPRARPFAPPPVPQTRGASGRAKEVPVGPAAEPGFSAAALERNLGAEVRTAIQREWGYPARALERGVTGVTMLDVTIGRDGRLIAARVAKGSGSDVLDRASLEAARRAVYPAAPGGLSGSRFRFQVRLDYTLR